MRGVCAGEREKRKAAGENRASGEANLDLAALSRSSSYGPARHEAGTSSTLSDVYTSSSLLSILSISLRCPRPVCVCVKRTW